MKVPITGRTDIEVKEQIEKEAPLREHSPSQAIDHILKLGLPLYLKQFSPALKRVGKKPEPAESHA